MTNYSFDIRIPEGLHARPCTKLVEILQDFQPVHITHNNHTITILSILELLLQKISYGSSITISTSSPLPPPIIEKLKNILSNQ